MNIVPNLTTAIFLVNKNVRAIRAAYEAGENAPTTVFKTFDNGIKKDDFLIVPTDTRHNMTVVKVVEVDVEVNLESTVPIAWVIAKVELDAFAEVVAGEKEMLEQIKSAEKRRKQEALREAIFTDQQEQIKALSIANMGGLPALETK